MPIMKTYIAQSLSNHHLDIDRAKEYTLGFVPFGADFSIVYSGLW